MNKQKVGILDIEIFPMLAYVWDRRDQNIATNQLEADWSVAAWAFKWLDDPASQVMYKDMRKSPDVSFDRPILEPLWKLLNEADAVITQNGARFDGPKLNARFILHGMQPPSPYKHIDTYQIASRVASFTSNKLDYLTEKLCVKYKKLTHSKFPGMSLWVECLKGNLKAWEEMKRYNIHDILATEELYNKLKAWAPESTARPYVVEDPSKQCRSCGAVKMTKQGRRLAKTRWYQQYKCQSCGSWQRGEAA